MNLAHISGDTMRKLYKRVNKFRPIETNNNNTRKKLVLKTRKLEKILPNKEWEAINLPKVQTVDRQWDNFRMHINRLRS